METDNLGVLKRRQKDKKIDKKMLTENPVGHRMIDVQTNGKANRRNKAVVISDLKKQEILLTGKSARKTAGFMVSTVALSLLSFSPFATAADVRELQGSPNGYVSSDGYVVSHREMFIVSEPVRVSMLQAAVKVEAVLPRQTKPITRVVSQDFVPKNTESTMVAKSPPVETKIDKQEAKQKKVSLVVYFDLDKNTLKKGEEEKLGNFLETLRGAKEINVTGYTCDLGTQAHNDALARTRARQVEKYLVTHGIPESSITTNGLGKCCFASSKDRELNRRAEVESLVPDDSTDKSRLPKGESKTEEVK